MVPMDKRIRLRANGMGRNTMTKAEAAEALAEAAGNLGDAMNACQPCDDELHALWAALAAYDAAENDGWQPIETAPEEGVYIVANELGEVLPCRADGYGRILTNLPGHADWTWGNDATHWRPLPDPPADGGKR